MATGYDEALPGAERNRAVQQALADALRLAQLQVEVLVRLDQADRAGDDEAVPLYATAAGHAIATQLDPARLARLLPPEPFPDAAAIVAAMAETVAGSLFTPGETAAAPPGPGPRPSLPAGRQEFQTQLDAVRRDGFAADPGRLDPAIDCLAVPWPQPGFPGALACLGPPDVMAASDGLVRAVLALAARPGGTPQQIVTGAAAALEEKRISGR